MGSRTCRHDPSRGRPVHPVSAARPDTGVSAPCARSVGPALRIRSFRYILLPGCRTTRSVRGPRTAVTVAHDGTSWVEFGGTAVAPHRTARRGRGRRGPGGDPGRHTF